MKNFLTILFICAVAICQGQNQTSYRIDEGKSTMTLMGETNLSEWDEQVTKFKGSLQAQIQAGEIVAVPMLELQIPVEGIKAPRKGMQTDTYEALQKKEHPEITFVATHVVIKNKTLQISGKLTVAGNSKDVQIECNSSIDNGEIVLTGTYNLKMSDYNVTPPKAMLGTLRVEENVKISFNLLFLPS